MIYGKSKVKKRLYVSKLFTSLLKPVKLAGEEIVVVGKPVLMLKKPSGCSPHFGRNGEYYTAGHCVNENTEGVVVNYFKPSFFFCPLLHLRRFCRYVRDVAILNWGNDGDIPRAVLSGTFTIANYIGFASPVNIDGCELLGRELRGIAYDYDLNDYVEIRGRVFDCGYVYYWKLPWVYMIDVVFFYSNRKIKGGFSGTNLYV